MIVVNLKGGLGNQMFQYALGRTLAIKNNTQIKMDLTFLRNQPRTKDDTFREYDLGIFHIIEEFATHDDRDLFGLNSVWGKFYSKFFKTGTCREKHFHFDPDVLRLGENVYLDGYWQSYKYFKNIESDIRQEFTFKNQLDERNQALAEEIQSNNSVCLNVRRADFVNIPSRNKVHGVCDMIYFNQAINYLASKISNFTIYVFSDDIPWCRQNIQTNYPTKIVDHEYAGDKFQYYLRHMSLCKHFIIPNSTFAWWAAWLSNNPEKIVIAPKKWFNVTSIETKDLIPDAWIRI